MSPTFPVAADDTALITKLQDVRDHLTQELQHLTAQVERKSVQLRGIESILEDATGASGTSVNGKATAPEAPAIAPVAAPEISPEPQSESVTPALGVTTQESVPAPEAAIVPAAKKPRSAKTPVAEKTTQSAKSKPPTSSKPSAKSKAPAAQSKPAAPKSEPSAKPTELRQALQPQFQGKTLAESIGEVLAKATEPLTARDVATELYEGLTIEDLKRAVKTVATILGTGRTKGDWQSPGKGLYQAGGRAGQSILGAAALSGVA